MTTTIENPGPNLSEQDVSNLEMRLGVPLPEQYRRFLLDCNGGAPTPDIVDVNGLPGISTDVHVFFGIGRLVESSTIEWNLATLADRLENGLLPIACDSSGNVFCLSLAGANRGGVLYCDLQSVFADYEAEPEIYCVASDFDTFFNRLRSFS